MSSFTALDHSTHLSDPTAFAQAAKAAGHLAILRYLPLPPGTLTTDNVGRLTAAEVTAYRAAGLGVGIVWETTQYRPLGGDAAGKVDGPAARAAASALGFPASHPIYGAVDFNPSVGQYPAIAAYFRASGLHPYANGPVLTYLDSLGLCAHSWEMNWGGSNYSDPHLHQQGGQVTLAGVTCDRNTGGDSGCDCIWWPPGADPGVFEQELHLGGNMRVDAHIPAAAVVNGRGWVDIDVPAGLGVSGSPTMNGAEALLLQALPEIRWAPYQIGGGKWRVAFDGMPAGGCDIHIPLG